MFKLHANLGERCRKCPDSVLYLRSCEACRRHGGQSIRHVDPGRAYSFPALDEPSGGPGMPDDGQPSPTPRDPASAHAPPAAHGLHTPRRITRLRVARLTGAVVIAALGQLAVDMPDGWFGRTDQLTEIGAVYCLMLLAATVSSAALQLLRREQLGRSTLLTPLILSVNIGVFVPALASDPTMAGVVVLWQVVTLARHFLDRPRPLARRGLTRHFDSDVPAQAWLARFGPAVRHLVIVALSAWLAVVGYDLAHHWLAQLICLAASAMTVGPISRLIWILFRHGRRAAVLAWVPLLLALAALPNGPAALSALALFQFAALLLLLRFSPTVRELVRHFYARPALFIMNTFGALIAVGTVLLTFPMAAAGTQPIEPLDAFFTATSAVCVTGLIVLDTPVELSTTGHVILLGLIQVGGLGIMVLSMFATVLLGGSIGLNQERALGAVMDPRGNVKRATIFVVWATLLTESIGAVALYPGFRSLGFGVGESWWRATFHSISAFCNAGFALQSDSLVVFRDAPWTLGVFAALITAGGLGFPILLTLWLRMRGEMRGRLPIAVRLVLWVSILLVVLGTVLYAALEWDKSLAGLPWTDRIVNAAFQSVTLRTAGFNSVDYRGLAMPTVLLMCVFMLIGASPGGTGGGIKTTTTGILLLAIPAIARGDTHVTVFGRTIPQSVVYRSAAIAVITLGLALTGALVLSGTLDLPLEQSLFEVASAVGTVGLSLGATSALNPLGKYVLVAMMFVGRIGPLTLALTMGKPRPSKVRYPEEDVAVG